MLPRNTRAVRNWDLGPTSASRYQPIAHATATQAASHSQRTRLPVRLKRSGHQRAVAVPISGA